MKITRFVRLYIIAKVPMQTQYDTYLFGYITKCIEKAIINFRALLTRFSLLDIIQ